MRTHHHDTAEYLSLTFHFPPFIDDTCLMQMPGRSGYLKIVALLKKTERNE
jgi:hypothetical protein